MTLRFGIIADDASAHPSGGICIWNTFNAIRANKVPNTLKKCAMALFIDIEPHDIEKELGLEISWNDPDNKKIIHFNIQLPVTKLYKPNASEPFIIHFVDLPVPKYGPHYFHVIGGEIDHQILIDVTSQPMQGS